MPTPNLSSGVSGHRASAYSELVAMRTVTDHREVESPASHQRSALAGWFDPGEPHPTRGPFVRWPHLTDGALAVGVFVGSLIAVAASALGDGEDFTIDSIGDLPAGAFALLAIAAATLLWRRQRPIAVSIVVMATMISWALAGYGDGQDLALVAAVYAVGRYTSDHRYSIATAAAVIAVSLLDTVIDTHQRIDIAPAFILGALLGTSGDESATAVIIWPCCRNAPNDSRPTRSHEPVNPWRTNDLASPESSTTWSPTRCP